MYRMIQLPKTKPTKLNNPFCRHLYTLTGSLAVPHQGVAWGIDPGVNFGIAIIQDSEVTLLHGALEAEERPGFYGLRAFRFLQHIASSYNQQGPSNLIIEGASYGDRFGQVKLAEIREGFFLGAITSLSFKQVEIAAPKAIRKGVFQDGTLLAHEVWKGINRDAAAALSMAVYSLLVLGG